MIRWSVPREDDRFEVVPFNDENTGEELDDNADSRVLVRM